MPEAPLVDDQFGGVAPEADCYTIQLDRSTHRELGIEVDPDSLEVESVDAGGLVARWNLSFPSRSVRAGDRILEANGRQGADTVLQECQQPRALVLTFRRSPAGAQADGSGASSASLQAVPRLSTAGGAGASPRSAARKVQVQVAPSASASAQSVRASASASVSSAGNSRGSRRACGSDLGRDSELNELLAAAPSRLSEPLRMGFARLLGELSTVEQRLQAQSKTNAQLVSEVQPLEALQHQLRDEQQQYRAHCARAPAGDTQHMKRLGEAQTRTRDFQTRLKTLVSEAEKLRRQRLTARDELDTHRRKREASAAEKTRLAELASEIREKGRRREALERELPNYLSTIRENGVMKGRLSNLKAGTAGVETPGTPRFSVGGDGPGTPRF